MTEKAYLVYLVEREPGTTWSEANTFAWEDGTFEAYNYYTDEQQAEKDLAQLNDNFKQEGRTNVKAFVHKVSLAWAEENFA